MDAQEMTTLSGEVSRAREELDIQEGSTLPVFLVDAQERLARMSMTELSAHFGHVVVALALRRPGWTPARVLAEFASGYRLTDDAWHGRVRNELVRALLARGVELDIPKGDDDGEGAGRAGEEAARGARGDAGPDGR